MDLFKDLYEGQIWEESKHYISSPDSKGGGGGGGVVWLGAEDLKDFKPISLVGSLYKLIAKVLANRLKKVMNGLVNPT